MAKFKILPYNSNCPPEQQFRVANFNLPDFKYDITHFCNNECSFPLHIYKIIVLVLSHSVISDSSRPHGLEPVRLLCPQDFQVRILEWVTISSSRRSSQSRDQTLDSCLGRQILYH